MANLKVLFLLFILVGTFYVTSSPASADIEPVQWSKVNIPADGKAGKWVMAAGSDIKVLTAAADGTLYGYANPSGTSYTLFKSGDGGLTWSYTGGLTASLVSIAAAPNQPDSVVGASTDKVYLTTDAAETLLELPAPPGAGSGHIEITSVAVAKQDNHLVIAAATRDTDAAEYGGVYLWDESRPFSWEDTGLANLDVYAIAFSPAFDSDRQLVAVATDETDTFVSSRIGDSGWDALISRARLDRDNSGSPLPVSLSRSAGITFSPGYNAAGENVTLYVAVDTGAGTGDVYRIREMTTPQPSAATDLNVGSAYGLNNVDVVSLAVDAESSRLLAGAADAARVYHSEDGGKSWTQSSRSPTGQSRTIVVTAKNGLLAATSGTESAVSLTHDGGNTWDQVSLVDTTISSLLDIATIDNQLLYLVTFGGKHSLWRSRNAGETWERVLNSTLPDVDSFTAVRLSPESGQLVFLAGTSQGNPVIWLSTDSAQSFTAHPARDPASGAAFSIDAWVVTGSDSLFIASYDGSKGLVYHSTSHGFYYSAGSAVGNTSINSIAVSPEYREDKNLLVGTTNGQVFWSDDDGRSFESLPATGAPPLTGNISVAFDSKYSTNHIVYAASDAAGKGIYRFTIGKSTGWEAVDGNLPAGAMINQLVITDNALYAANSKTGGGIERSLDPSYPLSPAFETVTRGLDSTATLYRLCQTGNQLWALDTTNKHVMTFIDTLPSPVAARSPADKTSGVEIKNAALDWEPLVGTTRYRWQLDLGSGFSAIPDGFEGETTASTTHLPDLELATTYHWRVRAIAPVLSPWSDSRSFTTIMGSGTTAPKLLFPGAGASGMPLKPIFQWDAVTGAAGYELAVSADTSFTKTVIDCTGDRSLPATAWQSTTELSYETTYYWKVRAYSADTVSAWSAVSAFKTATAPAPTASVASTPTRLALQTVVPNMSLPNPAPLPTPAGSDAGKWVLPLGLAVVGVLAAVLVVLIMIVRRMRR